MSLSNRAPGSGHFPDLLFVEPPRPRQVAAWKNAHWLVVATVSIGAFMGQLDASIVSLALPNLHDAFHASIGAVEWISLAYLLTLIGVIVAVGRLADIAGRKLLYTYGFAVFIAGSAMCGFAPSLPILIAARVFQALGASMLQANSVALIAQAMPREKLSRGIGIQGAAQAIGLAAGPAIGGLLIAIGGWRWIFFVNVPAGLLGLVLGWFLLPRSRNLQQRAPFDWTGAALFMPAVTAFLGAISFGSDLGWTSPLILAAGGVCPVLVLLFLRNEVRVPAPMIDLRVFRNVPFSAGIAAGLLSYLVLFGVLFLVPFYLETKRGLPTAAAGLLLTVLPLALGLAAPISGRLADRLGPRPITVTGMLVAGLGLLALGIVRRPETLLLGELAVIGLGIGAFTPANNATIMSSAPLSQSGVAGGLLNMARGLGTSLGVAVTGLIFTVASGHAAQRAHLRLGPSLAQGFRVAMFSLCACAVLAAAYSALRGSPRRDIS